MLTVVVIIIALIVGVYISNIIGIYTMLTWLDVGSQHIPFSFIVKAPLIAFYSVFAVMIQKKTVAPFKFLVRPQELYVLTLNAYSRALCVSQAHVRSLPKQQRNKRAVMSRALSKARGYLYNGIGDFDCA
nr:MAG TPA: hypothetical protein [Caudoviricetes sp.]